MGTGNVCVWGRISERRRGEGGRGKEEGGEGGGEEGRRVQGDVVMRVWHVRRVWMCVPVCVCMGTGNGGG